MPNSGSKQAYVQGFDCEYISFKIDVNVFERMYIAEYIYEGVVETSYKKITRADTNRDVHSRHNIGEEDSSQTYPAMYESAGKCRTNI